MPLRRACGSQSMLSQLKSCLRIHLSKSSFKHLEITEKCRTRLVAGGFIVQAETPFTLAYGNFLTQILLASSNWIGNNPSCDGSAPTMALIADTLKRNRLELQPS